MIHSAEASPGDDAVQAMSDGSLRIAATSSLVEIASHPVLRERYAALAMACERPGLHATLGADLEQRGECRYLREGAACLKNGGTTCFAVDGENRHLAIVEGGPSWIIHPSEPGIALVALEAIIETRAPSGGRMIAAGDFFVLPTERLDSESVLASDEHVASVHLPAESALGVQRYVAERDDDAVVLVSIAAVRRRDGEVRLVLGRVSPRPYRIYNSIEEETTAGGLDEETIEGLAVRALLDAVPLSQNAYKLDLAERLVRDAIRTLSAE